MNTSRNMEIRIPESPTLMSALFGTTLIFDSKGGKKCGLKKSVSTTILRTKPDSIVITINGQI